MRKCVANVLYGGIVRQDESKQDKRPSIPTIQACVGVPQAKADRAGCMRVVGAQVPVNWRGADAPRFRQGDVDLLSLSSPPPLYCSNRGGRRSFVAAVAAPLHFGGVKRRNLSFLFFSLSSSFSFYSKTQPPEQNNCPNWADASLWGCVCTYALTFLLICQYEKRGIST